jgi:hypothetical protein
MARGRRMPIGVVSDLDVVESLLHDHRFRLSSAHFDRAIGSFELPFDAVLDNAREHTRHGRWCMATYVPIRSAVLRFCNVSWMEVDDHAGIEWFTLRTLHWNDAARAIEIGANENMVIRASVAGNLVGEIVLGPIREVRRYARMRLHP